MHMTRLVIVGLLLVTGFAGSATMLPGARAQTTTNKFGNDEIARAARIDKRVETWQPTPGERRLDDIAWAQDLGDALRLAREHSRPIFLFTYSGCAQREHAMALQRC